jgi:hypothetical protein
VLQLGVLGCRSAHEREDIKGCAGDVTGETDLTGRGKGFGSVGWSMGEIYRLDYVSAII